MALREECTMKAEIVFPVVNQVECAPVKKVGWGGKGAFGDCTLFFYLAVELLVMQRVPAAVLHALLLLLGNV